MANTIILKQSSVASKVPVPQDLVLGEIAINTTDSTIYALNGVGAVVAITYSDAEARSAISVTSDTGSLTYDDGTGLISLAERSDIDIRSLISASGSLVYNNNTGEMSFTERTDLAIRTLFDVSGDLAYDNSTGIISYSERTAQEARELISVAGDLAYDNSTGIISYSERTIAELLTDIKTVDGTGSGLDADLLDGIDSTGFATAAQGTLANNAIPNSEKASVNGVATLGADGKILANQVPSIAITEVFSVNSQAAMLALGTAETGDVCIREDESKTYFLGGSGDPSVLADWKQFQNASAVTSIEGRTGIVVLSDLYLGLTAQAADSADSNKLNGQLASFYSPATHNHTGTYLGLTAKASDSNKLDNLNSTQFLRSDATDTHSGTITPSSTNAINLGSSSLKYANMYATSFIGNASTADYADLAENYEADADIEPGTVVCFGGHNEVTTCMDDADTAIAGIVSTDPAYTMNADLDAEFVATVALRGRVPCNVSGSVKKGDLMVSNGNGGARAEANPSAGSIIGRALADSEGDSVIEVVVA